MTGCKAVSFKHEGGSRNCLAISYKVSYFIDAGTSQNNSEEIYYVFTFFFEQLFVQRLSTGWVTQLTAQCLLRGFGDVLIKSRSCAHHPPPRQNRKNETQSLHLLTTEIKLKQHERVHIDHHDEMFNKH